jgi:hypothetical protein
MLTFYVSCAFGDIFKTRLDPTVEQHYGKNIKFYFKRSTLSFNPFYVPAAYILYLRNPCRIFCILYPESPFSHLQKYNFEQVLGNKIRELVAWG